MSDLITDPFERIQPIEETLKDHITSLKNAVKNANLKDIQNYYFKIHPNKSNSKDIYMWSPEYIYGSCVNCCKECIDLESAIKEAIEENPDSDLRKHFVGIAIRALPNDYPGVHIPKTIDEIKREFKANGITISDWAQERGFEKGLVYSILSKRIKGYRGRSHEAALALGLKLSPEQKAENKELYSC